MSGSTYIELPDELKISMKGLINITHDDSKWFLWFHIRHLNLLKTHAEKITKVDKKKWSMILILKVVNFLSLKIEHWTKKGYLH